MAVASILSAITDALTAFIGDYGLYAVFVLMLIDAVLPAASELVMVYSGAVAAGAFAGQDVVLFGYEFPEGFPAYVAMALAGTIGYTIGSVLGWWIGLRAGRPFLERHGRWLHLNEHKIDRAERWFERWEDWAVFLGRLTPVVRSFVSIPAGLFRAPAAPVHGAHAARLGDLVLCLRRVRLVVRLKLGGVPPRVPLHRLRDRRARRRRTRLSRLEARQTAAGNRPGAGEMSEMSRPSASGRELLSLGRAISRSPMLAASVAGGAREADVTAARLRGRAGDTGAAQTRQIASRAHGIGISLI